MFGGSKRKPGAQLPRAPANRKPAALKPAKPQQRAIPAAAQQAPPGPKGVSPVFLKPEARATKPRPTAQKQVVPKMTPAPVPQSTEPTTPGRARPPVAKPVSTNRTPAIPVPKPAATSKHATASNPTAAGKQPVVGALVKKPKKPKKPKKSVAAAGPRDTSPEEGRPTPFREWWRELSLGFIVLAWIVVYAVVHPKRASASRGTGIFEFNARGGRLYANGEQFSIKGVNWFGSEAFNGPPGGLDKHSVGWYFDFLERNDFNAVRLLCARPTLNTGAACHSCISPRRPQVQP